MSDRDLTQKTVAGLVWTALGKGAFTLIDIVVLVVLARLLTPLDFGIASAALVVIRFSTIFSRIGFGPALVQMEEIEERHIETAMLLSVTLSTVIGVLLFVAAPLVASFFLEPQIVPVLRVLAVTFPFKGYASVAQSLLRREFRFRWLARLDVASFGLGYAPVGISLALYGAGVWALVAAQLAQTTLRVGLLLTAVRPRLRPRVDRDALREIVYFGGGLTVGRIANFIALEGDYLIVGRFLGPAALGLYSRAYKLMGAPVTVLGNMLDNVLFPAMSRAQSDRRRLAKAYRRGLALVALIMLPLSAVFMVLAPELVAVALGPQWTEIVLPFRILTLGLFLGTSYKMSDAVARATAAVYRRAWRQGVYAGTVLVAAYVGQHWGLAGVAVGVLFALTVNFLLMTQLGIRVTGLEWTQMVAAHLPAVSLASLVGAVLWSLASYVRGRGASDLIVLISVISVTALAGLLLGLAVPRRMLGEDALWMIEQLKSYFSGRRRKTKSTKPATAATVDVGPSDGTPSAAQNLTKYLISASYLKPTQIWYRLRLVARRKLLYGLRSYVQRLQRTVPDDVPARVLPFPPWRPKPCDIDDLAAGTFTFLNQRLETGQTVDWKPAAASQLWRYNLHYFDYAVALGWSFSNQGDARAWTAFRDLASQWLERVPVAASVAWDAYPTSLRICNWIKAYGQFGSTLEEDPEFADRLRRSLYLQTSFLSRNVEHHLLNNHLLENGRALLLAGLFFADGDAAKWRRQGESILWSGLDQQVLGDGGQFERTPMYHQIVLDLYQEVIAVLDGLGEPVPESARSRVRSMRRWLSEMLHPDGKISLLNDAAIGIARPPEETLAGRTEPLADGLTVLSESGYAIFRDSARSDYLVLDCGAIGPDHQPGHGHCDALSFELSLNGQRLIVDSGVGDYYGDIDWRDYDRSTRAHNTVVVDGADQSETWGRFRVARRARVSDVGFGDASNELSWVAATHDGYRRLPGKVRHRRWVGWIDRQLWLVCDQVTGSGPHRLESHLHLHPDVRTTALDGGENGATIERDETVVSLRSWGLDQLTLLQGENQPIQGWYAPQFGVRLESPVWRLDGDRELPAWFGWVLCPGDSTVRVAQTSADHRHLRLRVVTDKRVYHILVDQGGIALEGD